MRGFHPRRNGTRLWTYPAVLLLSLAGMLGSVEHGYTQMEAASLRITLADTAAFPLVQLHVAALDAQGTPLSLLPAASLVVSENGAPLPIQSVEPVDIGVRVAFVVDPGDGLHRTGVRLSTAYASASESIRWFIAGRPWMVPDQDEVIVLVQEGVSTFRVTEVTSDPAEIAEGLLAYVPPSDAGFSSAPHYGDYARAALSRALDELEFSVGGQHKLASIVLFTPGSRADYADVAERAINLGIQIHIVLVRTDRTAGWTQYWGEALEPLAEVTGGHFTTTRDATGTEALFAAVTARRTQQVVSYRSASSAAGSRQVSLDLNTGAQTLSATAQYSVSPQPPVVQVLTPGAGSQIRRVGAEGSRDPAEAQPTFVTVVAQVTWPDGFPRQLRAARLLVDDVPTGQARVTEDGAEITWDIRGYQSRRPVPAVLTVQVEDELGLQAASSPVTVSVEYQPSSLLGLPETYLVYGSAAIALLALGLAVFLFLNRRKLAPALQQASENIVDFVERVTGRRSALVARAYLIPMEGFDEPPSKAFELYGTTAIGRSRRHADLLFHIHEEDSAISRLHCTILDEDDHFAIRDEDSSNGTFVNGEKLTPLTAVALQDGDLVDLAPLERGGLRFMFQLASADGSRPEGSDEVRKTHPRRGAAAARPEDASHES